MRKNKKLLLGGLSVLTLVAAGSGAVSTFAWFSATASATVTELTGNTNDLIRVEDHASVGGYNMRVKLIWSVSTKVDLTAGAAKAADGENVAQVIGGSYVIDQSGHVKKNTSGSVVKAAVGTVTLSTTKSDFETYTGSIWRAATDAEIYALNGKTLAVDLKASDQLRITIGDLIAEGDGAGAVGAYTALTDIDIGDISIAATDGGVVTPSYVSTLDTNGNEVDDTGLWFRYSASPKDDDGTSGESTSASYGTLTATLHAAV